MDDLIREFLIESQEGLDRMERCLTELETRPDDAALVAEIFRSVHTIKGTTGFLGFARLEQLAHAGENLLGMVRDGSVPANPAVITELLQLLDGLRSILRSIEAGEDEGSGNDTALIRRLEALQIGFLQIDALQPLAIATEAADEPPVSTEAATESLEPAGRTDAAKAGFAAESRLRVDVALLNRLMNLVGELVLTRNQVLQVATCDPRMMLLSRRLDMVTADLRESVMKARMQPVSRAFSKMPRMVRDLAQMLGRRVRLQMEGEETELDKSLLEAIKDPLTHAVRNALDHGIEPPAVREASGKDAEGTLRLRAAQEGSHVLVEIADDGAGIPVDKVRSKAVERGLISAEKAADLPEREVLQLIFVHGFSTASAVTTVSGRGVGMDVVRTNVEKIGGKVEIDSRPGQGTTMRLRIPLTLAIIPALIVHSAGQSFALPQGALSEFVRVVREDAARMIEWIGDAALCRVRGQLLPLVFLNRLLELDPLEAERDCFIAVLDVDGRRFGLVVDGLADPEEIVVKPLNAALKDIGIYTGATILGNGDLALILDPAAIAYRARIAHRAEEPGPVAGAASGGSSQGSEYLLVEAAGRRAAVPLGDVVRIERMPVSSIEPVGARLVLHFGGELLPVEDVGGVLGGACTDAERPVIVVVCRSGSRQVGVVVSHVLDVARGADLVEAGTGHAAAGVTLLKDRVTSIVHAGLLESDAGRDELSEAVEAVR